MTDVLLEDYARARPYEVAARIGTPDAALEVLGALPDALCPAIVAYLRADVVLSTVDRTPDATLFAWLRTARPEHAALLIASLAPGRRLRLLPDTRRRPELAMLTSMLAHAEDTVGALAVPAGLRVFDDEPCSMVTELLRSSDESPCVVHVLDRSGRHRGVVPPGRALRNADARIGDCVDRVPTIPSLTPIANALDLDAWMMSPELPVVTGMDGPFLGRITQAGLRHVRSGTSSREPIIEVVAGVFGGMLRVGGDLFETLAGGRRR